MRGFTKQGNWYVDSYYGNDTTGDGSKEAPFATLEKANQVAANKETVITSGFFNEKISPLYKQLRFISDGVSILYGGGIIGPTNPLNAAMPINSFSYLEGFKFVLFTETPATSLSDATVKNCEYHSCIIMGYWGIYHNNIFKSCIFTTDGSYTARYTNNTFLNCSGTFSNLSTTETLVILLNNHFENCESLILSTSTSPVPHIFDYNNIVGNLSGHDNAYWQSYGTGQFQQHGIASSTNQFNVDNSSFSDTEWWKCDFTLKTGSDNLFAGRDRLHIGAKGRGYRISANDLWTARDTGTVVNLQYNATDEAIERISDASDGEMETNEIDLGATFTADLLNIYQQVIDSTGSILAISGKVDYNEDASPDSSNQKITMDVEIQYGTSSGSLSAWTKFEAGKVMKVDTEGDGNADADFDETSTSRITLRYFKLRLKLTS